MLYNKTNAIEMCRVRLQKQHIQRIAAQNAKGYYQSIK